jgi:sugar-specific transcriptional regulator TrmB
MTKALQETLEQLGLAPTEAAIYLILLRNRQALGASAIAARAEMARSSVYPALTRLMDLGLVEGEPAYGSGFTAVRPDQGLESLIVRETQELSARERLAKDLVGELESLAGPISEITDPKVVQVLRDPRVISERFNRLQAETRRTVEAFVKAPILNPHRGNPEEKKAQRRGVHARALYEQAVISDKNIKPYLKQWIAAGEEARVYEGDLPYKLMVFDRQTVLLTLVQHGGQSSAMLVRHHAFANSLGILFDYFWQQSKPLSFPSRVKKHEAATVKAPDQTRKKTDRVISRLAHNGGRAPSHER